jgi:DNA (cytosine-5)-methyltransferase 1
MGTITTVDRHALVTPSHGNPTVDDVFFRMLYPSEIGRAMAFPSSYIVLGNQRQQVRLYGNGVTPPVMRKLVERCLATMQ